MPQAELGHMTIAYEGWGDERDPAVVLIAGLGGQLVMWPMGLVHAIAIAGFQVFRFDNRDVGLSTHVAGKLNLSEVAAALRSGGRPDVPYHLADMADDTIALFDHLDLDSAHLVGISMGAAIAQELAIRHSERVRSLTCLMGTTGAADVGHPTARGNRALFRAPPPERERAIEAMVFSAQLLASPGLFDAGAARRQAAWSYDRSFDPEGVGRQLGAIWASPDRTPQLRELSVPALVIHGSVDHLIPCSGGRAIAAAIPKARYVEIAGMGHELNEAFWPHILGPLLEHVAAS